MDPPYLRIASTLRGELEKMQPGDRLPTNRALEQRFGVSLPVASDAVRQLKSEGLVDEDRRVYRPEKYRRTWAADDTRSWEADMAGRSTFTEISVRKGDPLVRHVMRLVDGVRLEYGEWYYHSFVVKRAPRLLEKRDIKPEGAIEYLEERGWPSIHQEITLEAVMPSPADTELLQLPPHGVPILLERRTGTSEGKTLFTARLIRRADKTLLYYRR